jgi:hypothetical protein
LRSDEDSEDIKPKVIMRYPCGTLVYIYVDLQGPSWIELSPTPEVTDVFSKETMKCLEEVVQCDNSSCLIFNIIDEAEFLVHNMQYILKPS